MGRQMGRSASEHLNSERQSTIKQFTPQNSPSFFLFTRTAAPAPLRVSSQLADEQRPEGRLPRRGGPAAPAARALLRWL